MKKVCFIGSTFWPLTFHMGPHIKKISEKCFVTLVAKDINSSNFGYFSNSILFKDIRIERKISFFIDILTFIELYFFFRREKFECVHSITPKAGLLTLLAAKFAFVPIRIHTFTGQVWVNKKGLIRFFFMFIDRIMAILATQVITDSPAQKSFLVINNIVKTEKVIVLANGSIVGVDTNRFRPDVATRLEIRKLFGIKSKDVVFIFVGRLNREKGVGDLINAFHQTSSKFLNSHLLIVGPNEENFDQIIDNLNHDFKSKIYRVSQTHNPEKYMAASDILCLPSYREGFGNVIIEAASVGLPAIASRIYGLSDSIVDKKTGLLHEVGNVQDIANKMNTLCENSSLRLAMGSAAQSRAINLFSEIILTSEFERLYTRLGIIQNISLNSVQIYDCC